MHLLPEGPAGRMTGKPRAAGNGPGAKGLRLLGRPALVRDALAQSRRQTQGH